MSYKFAIELGCPITYVVFHTVSRGAINDATRRFRFSLGLRICTATCVCAESHDYARALAAAADANIKRLTSAFFHTTSLVVRLKSKWK